MERGKPEPISVKPVQYRQEAVVALFNGTIQDQFRILFPITGDKPRDTATVLEKGVDYNMSK